MVNITVSPEVELAESAMGETPKVTGDVGGVKVMI